MKWNKILWNSVTISLPKNIIQFSLGVILFWIIFGFVNIWAALVALVGFLLTYSSVYFFNDAMDHEEDRKDREKIKWKLVARGDIGVGSSINLSILLMILGITVSLFVNKWFVLMMALLVFLNFLHSSSFTRFKSSIPKTTVNMTFIQFLKYSCGWFALTSNILLFPFWLILTFSIAYTGCYIVYKFRFRGHKIRKNGMLFGLLGSAGFASYILSFLLYGFPLMLLILLFLGSVVVIALRFGNLKYHRINNMLLVENMLLLALIVSFLIFLNPVIAGINNSVSDNIEIYEENISESLPPIVTKPVESVFNQIEKYNSLDSIEGRINSSLKSLVS